MWSKEKKRKKERKEVKKKKKHKTSWSLFIHLFWTKVTSLIRSHWWWRARTRRTSHRLQSISARHNTTPQNKRKLPGSHDSPLTKMLSIMIHWWQTSRWLSFEFFFFPFFSQFSSQIENFCKCVQSQTQIRFETRTVIERNQLLIFFLQFENLGTWLQNYQKLSQSKTCFFCNFDFIITAS